jgi:hypothetical protein
MASHFSLAHRARAREIPVSRFNNDVPAARLRLRFWYPEPIPWMHNRPPEGRRLMNGSGRDGRTLRALAAALLLASLPEAASGAPPAARSGLAVPIVKQARERCGQAALEMVLRFYGADAAALREADRAYDPALRGSLITDLAVAARTAFTLHDGEVRPRIMRREDLAKRWQTAGSRALIVRRKAP